MRAAAAAWVCVLRFGPVTRTRRRTAAQSIARQDDRWRAVFLLGFTAAFTALGASASALGFLLARHRDMINLAGGSLIIVMGLGMAGVVRIPLLHSQIRFDLTRIRPGPVGAAPLGAAFAFSWTPCVGPVLASILTAESRSPA